MTFKAFVRTFGAAALVGGASLAALPATAQDETPRERNRQMRETRGGDDNSAARQEMRQQRMESAQRTREYTAPQVRAQPQARVEAQGQVRSAERSGRDWSRGDARSSTGAERMGRDWNRRDNSSNDWGQARAAQAQADAQVRAQAQAQARAAAGQSTQGDSRNRSYSDGARNRTYGSGYRDGYRADQRQDRVQQRGAYSSGYRDGVRNEHYRDGRRYEGNHQRWSNNWRRDNRYNWYGYRNANRSLFSIGAYYSPYRNYRYSRLSSGFYLDSLFYGNSYWINDPWQYRLPAAYGPYRWIRYYDDALLVNIYTGQVEDVVYDFFW